MRTDEMLADSALWADLETAVQVAERMRGLSPLNITQVVVLHAIGQLVRQDGMAVARERLTGIVDTLPQIERLFPRVAARMKLEDAPP